MKNKLAIKTYFALASLLMFASASLFAQVNPEGFSSLESFKSAGNVKTKVKKHIISFGFFSPLNDHLSFGYDEAITPDIVLSGQVGIIGLGFNAEDNGNPRGSFLEAGVKFFFTPDYITDGMRKYSSMQGMYFKPMIVASVFNETVYYNYGYSPSANPSYQIPTVTSGNSTFSGVALLLNIGRQWIVAHSISFDMYVGLGYNVSATGGSNIQAEYYPTNYFSYLAGTSAFPIALDAGINVGVPF